MSATMKRHPSAASIVTDSWGNAAPDWVMTLAQFCDRESQASAARKIGRSASLINQVLKNKYTGDLGGVEARVLSAFCKTLVPCPVLGGITGPACLAHQQAPYNPANHVSVRLYAACRRCPHNIDRKDHNNAGR